ncbi:hypothetical protein Sango_0355900 [Sesamum angolense]|uniref:Uncharacterized protein n=1 Tax=Sesamum angolense TaxID=2727404 RepID=A0AAE2C3I9_9LAMI|nr:hypothetical protein Sango_0355900 [Sesamum angolense]
MNAVTTSDDPDNGVCGSDSDANSDDSPGYYQPISTVDSGGEDEDHDRDRVFSDQDPNPNFFHLPNGWVENGVSSIDLSDKDHESDGEEEEEEEEEAMESERAIERAFREDERRRSAPLTAENAVRVMEAMRGISFGGGAPDWAGQVPEDQWIDRLRRLRRPSSAALAASATN